LIGGKPRKASPDPKNRNKFSYLKIKGEAYQLFQNSSS
jgi:hypothetical protein